MRTGRVLGEWGRGKGAARGAGCGWGLWLAGGAPALPQPPSVSWPTVTDIWTGLCQRPRLRAKRTRNGDCVGGARGWLPGRRPPLRASHKGTCVTASDTLLHSAASASVTSGDTPLHSPVPQVPVVWEGAQGPRHGQGHGQGQGRPPTPNPQLPHVVPWATTRSRNRWPPVRQVANLKTRPKLKTPQEKRPSGQQCPKLGPTHPPTVIAPPPPPPPPRYGCKQAMPPHPSSPPGRLYVQSTPWGMYLNAVVTTASSTAQDGGREREGRAGSVP